MYPTYYFKIKRPNPLIFGRKEEYVTDITQSKPVLHVEQPDGTIPCQSSNFWIRKNGRSSKRSACSIDSGRTSTY